MEDLIDNEQPFLLVAANTWSLRESSPIFELLLWQHRNNEHPGVEMNAMQFRRLIKMFKLKQLHHTDDGRIFGINHLYRNLLKEEREKIASIPGFYKEVGKKGQVRLVIDTKRRMDEEIQVAKEFALDNNLKTYSVNIDLKDG